jgi:hypothetical protein
VKKKPNQQQTLYFIKGAIPTAEQLAEAEALGTRSFRNALKPSNPPRIGCKAAGAVPENYKKAKHVTVITTQPQSQPQQSRSSR